MITMNDIYTNMATQTNLLSTYNSEFWTFYKTNHTYFDRYFVRKYKSFAFFDQDETDDIDTVKENFIQAVYDHLLVNDKRYNELYRINVVPDDDTYSITENYYMSESYSGTTRTDSANKSGQRTDINNLQVGSQRTEELNKVTPWNTGTEDTDNSSIIQNGTRNDINQLTQGEQNFTSQGQTSDGHTLLRHGAIGTMTVDDVLKKHSDYWSGLTAFYDFVFKEINKELLIIGG